MESLSNSFKELGLVLFTVPTYAVLILLELYFSNRQERDKPLYSWRDSFTNLYLTLSQMAVDVATRWVPTYLAFEFCYRYHNINWENPIWYWFWLLVLQDFCFYWIHRTEHSSRFFWAVHATHHSSEHFNLSVGFRSSVLEPFYRFVFYLPLPSQRHHVFVCSDADLWAFGAYAIHPKNTDLRMDFCYARPSSGTSRAQCAVFG
jgi:sterol desaturase/sphingolipid hydroxylase (fatty acid hydroxylase superfamily)